MSHSVTVKMIADQEIFINHHRVNIHDIKTVLVNSDGVITGVYFKDETGNTVVSGFGDTLKQKAPAPSFPSDAGAKSAEPKMTAETIQTI